MGTIVGFVITNSSRQTSQKIVKHKKNTQRLRRQNPSIEGWGRWASKACFKGLKDIGTQNFYYLYLLGILAEYLISYFGRFVAFSC